MEYRHTQLGKVIIAALGISTILVLLPFVGIGTPLANQLGVVIVLVIALVLFYSLTVEVSNGTLRCHFGPGIIRRRFSISEIEEVRSVRNPWYSGWGIRWRPGQYVLWNVSGRQAVELTLKGGKRFRIGTDEPDALVQAIQTNKAASI